MTVFLTTHYMEEAAGADYVIVIDNGSIAAKGTPADLKERYTSDKLSFVSKDADALCAQLDAHHILYRAIADQIVISIPSTISAVPLINQFKDLITGFEVTKGTMDDAFIAITGKEIRE
jgi:multidrug/hemolysin transport system ATP-binding protein